MAKTATLVTPLASFVYPGTIYAAVDPTTRGVTFTAKAGSVTAVPLTVKALASQTGDLTDWKDSTGAILASIASTGQLSLNGAAREANPSFNGNGALPGSAPGIVQGPAALVATIPDSVVSSNLVGGTNEIMSTRYEAIKFNTGLYTLMGGLKLSMQVDNSVPPNSLLQVGLYTDNAGVPGTLVNGFRFAAPRSDGMNAGSFTPVFCSFGSTAVTPGTDYWVVLDKNGLTTGVTTLDSRNDVGTNVVATSTDAVTWTLAPGTKTLVYTVLCNNPYGIAGSSTTQAGGVFSSVYQQGIVSRSVLTQAVNAISLSGQGVLATSTYAQGIQASSIWSQGVLSTSQQNIALSGAMSGTLAGNSGASVLQVTRTSAMNGFTLTGDLIFANDGPSGGTPSGNLLRIQSGGVNKFTIAQSGILQNITVINPTTLVGIALAVPTGLAAGATTASGGALVNGGVYPYVVCPINALGTVGPQSNEIFATIASGGTGTSGTQVLSWTNDVLATGYKVYRGPNGGAAGSENVLVGTVWGTNTLTDTAGSDSAGSPASALVATPSSRIGSGTGVFFPQYAASAIRGSGISLGSAPYDGVGTGKFAGSGSGTVLAMNLLSTFGGNLADYQVLGVSRYKLSASGIETLATSDAITGSATIGRIKQHLTSGTPAANFGWSENVQLHSSTNTLRDASSITTFWSTATDGSQTSGMKLNTVIAGSALTNYVTLNGGAAMLAITGAPASSKLLTLSGASSGTANIAEFQNTGTMRTAINSRGDFLIGRAGTGAYGGEMTAPTGLAAGASSGTGGALTNGATYFWVIVAVDTFGNETVPSAEVTATIPAGAGTAGSQVLTWTAMVGPMSIRIYRTAANGAAGSESVLAGTVTGTTATFTDTATGSAQSPLNPIGSSTVRQPLYFGGYNHNAFGAPIYAAESESPITTRPLVAFGSGPFDGATSGFYSGQSGTILGINLLNTARGFVEFQALGASRFSIVNTGAMTNTISDSATAATTVLHNMIHRSTGTPAASFGGTIKTQLESSTNVVRDASALVTTWTTATDGSQASQLALQTVTAGGALTTALTIAPGAITLPDAANLVLGTTTGTKIGTATTQKIGLWNHAPAVQPTVTGSRGGNAALASLLTALAGYGAIVDSTTA